MHRDHDAVVGAASATMARPRTQLDDPPRTVGTLRDSLVAGPRRVLTIEVEHLAKHYGELHAVDGISFTAREGEILGFLGHNGAGKTTTIRMLTGRARPTGGVARVCGCDVVHEREHMKPLINLVFEEQNLCLRLSGRENLQLFADLHGVSRARADELLETVGLGEVAGRKVKTFSNGMQQRCWWRARSSTPRASSSSTSRPADSTRKWDCAIVQTAIPGSAGQASSWAETLGRGLAEDRRRRAPSADSLP